MIVVDTSILSHLYFPSPNNKIVEMLRVRDNNWSAPYLWKSEFINIAFQYYKKSLIFYEDIFLAYSSVNSILDSINIYSEAETIIELVKTSGCTSYHCEFVALAKKLNIPLITFDKQILREFPTLAFTPEDYIAQAK